MWTLSGLRTHESRVVLFACSVASTLPALLTIACGSSSSRSITAPTADSRCALTIGAEPRTVDATGAQGALTITVNRECGWSARSEVDWIAVAASSGQGDGTITFNVARNTATAARRGVIVVNEQRIEITQAAAACVFTLDGDRHTFEAAGGSRTLRVSSQADCAWTAVSHASWVDVRSGSAGSGAGSVTIVASANTTPDERTGSLTIAGRALTVTRTHGNARRGAARGARHRRQRQRASAFTISQFSSVFLRRKVHSRGSVRLA